METKSKKKQTTDAKRGKKPKDCKIVQLFELPTKQNSAKPNIIIYLKCFLKDLNMDLVNCLVVPFEGKSNNNEMVNETTNNDIILTNNNELNVENTQKKINHLFQYNNIDNFRNKSCACFWCSYDFDTNVIYIPKKRVNNIYHVYGCFCSPECAVGYLMKENIDSSDKFEQYCLLQNLYGTTIKPAPDPHYLLDKFYGNLPIQNYRKLFHKETTLFVLDKPITRVFPEIHEESCEIKLNKGLIITPKK